MQKYVYKVSTIISLLIVSFFAIFIAYAYILDKENEFLYKKYAHISFDTKNSIDFLIKNKKNTTLSIAIAYANNYNISELIIKNDINKFEELKKASLLLRDNTTFKNVWFQILDDKGVSLYRTWSDKRNDDLSLIRDDVKQIIKNPKIQSTISVGSFDMTFKSMVPIYKNGVFVGVLEVITHFNSIANYLKQQEKLEPIILVDNKYKNQLTNPFTKEFIGDNYIANIDFNKNVKKFIENEGVDTFLNIKNFKIINKHLVIRHSIIHNRNKIADFIMVKDINTIDISDIKSYKNSSLIYLSIFIILITMIITILSYFFYSKELKKLYSELYLNHQELNDMNINLEKTVKEEIEKNEKKNNIIFQQSKMAAMGEMIGNIAHQWRQPLSVITTAATGIKIQKELGVLTHKDEDRALDGIINSANYLSNTIDDFRDFFMPNKEYAQFESTLLFDKTIKLVETNFANKNITLIKNIEKLNLYGLENELLQVIINILNNAKDELIKNEYQDKYIFIKAYKYNDDFVIKIKDNAGGIEDKIIDRIFEPYFTTKHKSQGTGIGLYMAKEIISKHMHGYIEASTKKYTYNNVKCIGAQFTIKIPIDL